MKNQFLKVYTYCLVSNNDWYYVSKDYDNTIKIREGKKGFFLKKRNEFRRSYCKKLCVFTNTNAWKHFERVIVVFWTKTKKTNFQLKKKENCQLKIKRNFYVWFVLVLSKAEVKKYLPQGIYKSSWLFRKED